MSADGRSLPDTDAAVPARPAAGERRGEGLIRLSWTGTAVYTVVAVADVLAPATLQPAVIAVSVVLFVVGMVAFAAAYLRAIARSRYELIGIGGLFFLAGSAPRRVQRHLMGSFAAEIIVSVVAASIGLASSAPAADNPAAFGLLTPMFGLGLAGLWAASFGVFPPRTSSPGGPGPPAPPGVTGRRGAAG